MTIENHHQLENTRRKLARLEELFAHTRNNDAVSEHVRELTLRSLKKRINKFKEEIGRFETRVSPTTQSD